MFTRTGMAATALLGVIAVVACRGTTSPSSDLADGVSSSGNETEEDTNRQESSSASSESPIDELLGIPFTDDDALKQNLSDLSRRAEAKIAEYMLSQGLHYQVVDYGSLDAISSTTDFEGRVFAEAYRFGIASNPFEESFGAFDTFEDPNQECLMSPIDGEREVPQRALSGELHDFGTDDVQSFETSGCQGDASNELFSFSRVFEQFGSEYKELEEAFDADSRIVEATSGCSACMTEAGFRFTDRASVEADIERRYEAIVRAPGAFTGGDTPPISGASGGNVVLFGSQPLNSEFQERVEDLAVAERAIAVTGWDCGRPFGRSRRTSRSRANSDSSTRPAMSSAPRLLRTRSIGYPSGSDPTGSV